MKSSTPLEHSQHTRDVPIGARRGVTVVGLLVAHSAPQIMGKPLRSFACAAAPVEVLAPVSPIAVAALRSALLVSQPDLAAAGRSTTPLALWIRPRQHRRCRLVLAP